MFFWLLNSVEICYLLIVDEHVPSSGSFIGGRRPLQSIMLNVLIGVKYEVVEWVGGAVLNDLRWDVSTEESSEPELG